MKKAKRKIDRAHGDGAEGGKFRANRVAQSNYPLSWNSTIRELGLMITRPDILVLVRQACKM